MRLINNHRKLFVSQISNAIHNKREFLNSGDDDFLTLLKRLAQFCRTQRRRNNVFHFRKIFNIVAQLFIQQTTVGNDNHRIKNRAVCLSTVCRLFIARISLNQLIRQPSNGIRFARAGRVLNQIAFAHALFADISNQTAHHL